jgi:hypothetical protein
LNSILLHDRAVTDLSTISKIRRHNLTTLRTTMGPAKLSEETGIDVRQLYQMTLAKGKARRPISDERARSIEKKLGLPPAWLDTDRRELPEDNVIQLAGADVAAGAWPFENIARERFARLTKAQRDLIEAIVLVEIEKFEGLVAGPDKKSGGHKGRRRPPQPFQ